MRLCFCWSRCFLKQSGKLIARKFAAVILILISALFRFSCRQWLSLWFDLDASKILREDSLYWTLKQFGDLGTDWWLSCEDLVLSSLAFKQSLLSIYQNFHRENQLRMPSWLRKQRLVQSFQQYESYTTLSYVALHFSIPAPLVRRNLPILFKWNQTKMLSG